MPQTRLLTNAPPWLNRGGEDLLEDVLRVFARPEHVAAEREQPRLVALHERLEGAVMAAPHERDELLVGLKPEQGRAARERGEPCSVLECGRFQDATPVKGPDQNDTVTASKLRSSWRVRRVLD